ncbi:DUF3742 family protein [Pseudomonas sp. JUb52]|uniref:DUF3742 family protein n=1 Tax=Pseudomonas sp. JUb52 TaxID=2485127 RepID=UPI001049527B
MTITSNAARFGATVGGAVNWVLRTESRLWSSLARMRLPVHVVLFLKWSVRALLALSLASVSLMALGVVAAALVASFFISNAGGSVSRDPDAPHGRDVYGFPLDMLGDRAD